MNQIYLRTSIVTQEKCQVCPKEISSSELGQRSHYRKHVRDKDITDDEMRTILRSRFALLQTFGVRK